MPGRVKSFSEFNPSTALDPMKGGFLGANRRPSISQRPSYLSNEGFLKKYNPKGLKVGDKGPDVEELQRKLVSAGMYLGKTGKAKDGVDGKFGPDTQGALTQLMNMQAKAEPDPKSPRGDRDGSPLITPPKFTKIPPTEVDKKTRGFFLDSISKCPDKVWGTMPKSGDPVILIKGYTFYSNQRVTTPSDGMGTYYSYRKGVKIKTDSGKTLYLETGVDAGYTQTSVLEGGFKGIFRKLFPNFVQIVKTRPLKDSDFTENQKEVVFNVIQNAIKRTGKRYQGCTEYIDYDQDISNQLEKDGGATTTEMLTGTAFSDKFRMATLLGRFCYKMQGDGTYLVTDDYDFNKWKNFTVPKSELEGKTFPEKISYIRSKTDLSYYGAIRHIGYLEHPAEAPKETKTKIALNISPGEFVTTGQKSASSIA
jgi:hypothetical protein